MSDIWKNINDTLFPGPLERPERLQYEVLSNELVPESDIDEDVEDSISTLSGNRNNDNTNSSNTSSTTRRRSKDNKRNDKDTDIDIDNDKETDNLLDNDKMNKTKKMKSILITRKLPYFLNPFIQPNAAISLSYFDVGIAIYFLVTPVSYYLIKKLDVSSTQFNAYGTLIGLPWSLKFLFGMITDGIPILSYRRKSWLAIGWFGYIAISIYLGSLDSPGFSIVTAMMFLMTCSYLLADVCTDTLCVERARYESDDTRGSLQTSGYTIRAFGCVIGAVLGAILYNTDEWGWGLTINQLFLLNALIPLTGVVPAIWNLIELAATKAAPTLYEQWQSIWSTLQLMAVWWPITFIYTYNVFQIPNAAWTNFLVIGLGFTDFELGMLTVATACLFWLGMIVYKAFFFNSSWRNIYIATTLLNFLFSIGQIVLILRLNLQAGIPDFVFALGDSGIATFIQAMQYMPSCIMFVMLCPDGSEGVVYALLTTISNLAGAVASDIGTAMTLIWDVSNEALESGDYSGLLKLTILTSCLQVFPLVFVWILPDSKEEQKKLQECGISTFREGLILLLVIIISLVGTIAINVWLIWYG